MTARVLIVPGAMPSRDANGKSLPAKLRFYSPGTTTPATVFTDNTLTVAHPFPLLSDSAGRWPAIWASDANSFDVAWSDQVFDALIATYTGISPANDAVLASTALSQAAADQASAFASAATSAATAAANSAASALANANEFGNLNTAITQAQSSATLAVAAASAAATSAENAAQFDPTLFVTRVAGLGGNVSASDLKTALSIHVADLTDYASDQAAAHGFAVCVALLF